MTDPRSLSMSLVTGMVVVCGMLLFYSTLGAAPPAGQSPFVDATVQREEMLRELRSIRDLLKEQNGLLKEFIQKSNDNPPARR